MSYQEAHVQAHPQSLKTKSCRLKFTAEILIIVEDDTFLSLPSRPFSPQSKKRFTNTYWNEGLQTKTLEEVLKKC